MVIDRSVRIRPGVYRLKASGDAPGITIRGENITVDFTGVTIEGGEPSADPDSYIGTGILIDGGSRVTVTGATIRGYKVGLHARRSPHLRLANNDLSYNWKQRLWSGIEKESLVDWMSYHNNEKDEWLRYGAAIYLSECDDARIENNRAMQGQNGLMITKSARARIWNNTFSWLSAIGIGLYRTTDSIIQHNRIDWAVRGYSHSFYHRGQDSAAILMYEQSSRNTVAYNSATHGGDGLFLWAGQSTMDTGQGGANDNLFYGNDFSHAVANGIEATFSRNKFITNRVDDCWHGVWGGYSYDSAFVQNSFAANTEAIAIEHGQNITIHSNTFKGDETAIRLWANPSQDPNWGYPKHRDTRSRDYVIQANRFDGHKTVLNVLRTSGVRFGANTYANVGSLLQAGADVKALELEPLVAPPVLLENAAPARLDGAIDARLPEGARRGRSTIIVDEWGPYDYKSPKVWPAGKITERPLILRVLGPPGRWSLQSIRGGTTTSRSGSVPGELKVVPAGPGVDLNVALEYVGEETTSPRGKTSAAGRPVPVPYSLFDPAVDWHVKFWRFDAASDPLDAPAAFQAKLKEPPVKSESVARLSYLSSRALSQGLPNDRVAFRADGAITLPPGRFEMAVISDDGVRVWVDDRIVVDRWTVHESTVDRAPLTGGRHRLRVEYFERTGWAELQVRFRRL